MCEQLLIYSAGLPDARPVTPAALTALIDSDTVVYAEVVKRTGASAD